MNRRQEMIDALASAPADLRRVTRNAAALTGPQVGWSLVDILNHLIHVETAARARMMQVIEKNRPAIYTIQPEESQHDLEKSPQELLVAFETARGRTITLLQELALGSWQRKATFEDGREVNLRTLVQMLIDHDTEHLSQALMLPRNIKDSS